MWLTAACRAWSRALASLSPASRSAAFLVVGLRICHLKSPLCLGRRKLQLSHRFVYSALPPRLGAEEGQSYERGRTEDCERTFGWLRRPLHHRRPARSALRRAAPAPPSGAARTAAPRRSWNPAATSPSTTCACSASAPGESSLEREQPRPLAPRQPDRLRARSRSPARASRPARTPPRRSRRPRRDPASRGRPASCAGSPRGRAAAPGRRTPAATRRSPREAHPGAPEHRNSRIHATVRPRAEVFAPGTERVGPPHGQRGEARNRGFGRRFGHGARPRRRERAGGRRPRDPELGRP